MRLCWIHKINVNKNAPNHKTLKSIVKHFPTCDVGANISNSLWQTALYLLHCGPFVLTGLQLKVDWSWVTLPYITAVSFYEKSGKSTIQFFFKYTEKSVIWYNKIIVIKAWTKISGDCNWNWHRCYSCLSQSRNNIWGLGASTDQTGMLDTSPPIFKFENSKFTIVIGHALILTLNPNPTGLNPNRKSQTKTLIPNL